MLEYLCKAGHRLESLEDRREPSLSVQCTACKLRAERCVSAPRVKVPSFSVSTGRSEPPPPGAMSTRSIGDGQPINEWRAERKKLSNAARKAWISKELKL